MKKIISLVVAFAIVFPLGLTMADEYESTSFVTLQNPTCLYVYDLNNDGNKEIIVGASDGILRAYDISGAKRWEYNIGQVPYSIYVSDIDGDGRADIVIGTGRIDQGAFEYSSGTVTVLTHFGRLKWSYETTSAVKGLYVYDIDGDGNLDVLASSNDGKLYALNNNGKEKWNRFTGSMSHPFVANVLGGADKSIIHGTAVLNKNGRIVNTAPHLFEWRKYIVRDLNRNRRDDILMVSQYAYVSAFALDNTTLEVLWVHQCFGDAMDAVVYDIDGDRNLEVIVSSSVWSGSLNRYSEGNIYILDARDGSVKESIPLDNPAFYLGVLDIDGDGQNNIIYTSDQGVNVVLEKAVEALPETPVEAPTETAPPSEDEPAPRSLPGFGVGAVATAFLIGYYLKKKK